MVVGGQLIDQEMNAWFCVVVSQSKSGSKNLI